MNTDLLITHGNQCRDNHQPAQALAYYAQAFIQDPDNPNPWNNYGNVIREMGFPERSIPFLQHAIALDPTNRTAQFNLAVSYLLMGDYERGWSQYEHRWNYEHLAGTMPQYVQPRWQGQDLKGKTILVMGEQGHGDNIQFSRFIYNLHEQGGRVLFQVTDGLIPMFQNSPLISYVGSYADPVPEFDYWIPVMSIPGVLGIRVNNIPQVIQYLGAPVNLTQEWAAKLGSKNKLRIGFSWSGRRDAWLNQHKGLPFEVILDLIKRNPTYEWINLQIDSSDEESQQLANAGVVMYPGAIRTFCDTAGLMMNLDLVLSVDTAVSHLAGALGRPTWIMLNQFALDWRWLLHRDDSPWYPTAKLFRQPTLGDWNSVTDKIHQYLSWFKV